MLSTVRGPPILLQCFADVISLLPHVSRSAVINKARRGPTPPPPPTPRPHHRTAAQLHPAPKPPPSRRSPLAVAPAPAPALPTINPGGLRPRPHASREHIKSCAAAHLVSSRNCARARNCAWVRLPQSIFLRRAWVRFRLERSRWERARAWCLMCVGCAP